MISKIIFSGQILRHSSTPIIEWFYNLLSHYAKATTNLPVYCCLNSSYGSAKYDDYIGFDLKKFYSFYGIEYSDDLEYFEKDILWAKLFYNTEYNRDAYEYLYSIFKDSLVIAHELSSLLSTALNYFNIPYIDINTDPIRFLEDQMFCFRSNNKEIYSKLLKYKYPEEEIYLRANYIKARNLTPNHSFNLADNSILFCGQTSCDKTLIEKESGTIYSILDHKNDFEKNIEGYSKIYYKKHPYSNIDEATLDYLNSFYNIEITDCNIYELFSSREIKSVLSISSGASIEAKYFGKKSISLLRESIPMQYENNFDEDKYISIFGDYFSLNFWSDILSPLIKTKKYDRLVGLASQKNLLRNSRGYKAYWGYRDFEHETILEDIRRDEILKKIIKDSFKQKDNFSNRIKKLLINFCCIFIFKKENRKAFRKKLKQKI